MFRNKRMTLFFLICVIFNLGANFVHPVTPTIFNNLNLGSYMFGIALASMLVMNFLFSPFWGKINDYISSRSSLLIGAFGYGIGQLFFGLAQTEGQFIAARMFAGVFTGGAFVSILTYVINVSKTDMERGTNLAITAAINAIASAFGYFIGGFLGEYSTYLPIWIQVATLCTSGVLFFIVCEEDAKIPFKELKIKTVVKEANPFNAFFECRKFLTLTLSLIFLVCAFQNMANTASDQTFNYYIRDQFKFTSGYNGVLKGIMGFVTLIVNSTVTIWLMRKTDIKKSVIYVMGLCSIAAAGIVFVTGVIPFVIINILLFTLNAICLPIMQEIVAAASNDKSAHRNLIMGFYNSMKSLGSILGAAIAGVIYTSGPKFPFIFGFVSFVLGTFFAYLYFKRSKKEKALE